MDVPAELITALRAARHVAVLTGAGISKESGIPTFREAGTGLWAQYRPEDLATAEAYLRDPRMVWEWYASRREQLALAEPNPGHYALAEMERRIPRFSLITQNIDGLHHRAGSQNVIELHGNLQRVRCFDEGIVVDTSLIRSDEVPPRCPFCGGLLRPDVVWFGETLPMRAVRAAQQAASLCDLFFSVGTSSLVEPAASLPSLAIYRGVPVVEVNPAETPLSEHAAYVLRGPAGEVLPALIRATWH